MGNIYIFVGVRWGEVTFVEATVVSSNCVNAPKNHLLCVVLQ